jgi:hypothetical protein
MEKNFVTAAQVQAATETTETEHATPYPVPTGVSKLVEVGVQIIPNGAVTDDEDYSAVFKIQIDDAAGNNSVNEFASDVLVKKTSGAVVLPSRVHDCNIPVAASCHLRMLVTFNKALTTTPSWRVFGKLV